MKARQTQDELDRVRMERIARVKVLEKERGSLALEAAMGNLKARKRTRVIRTEIAEQGLAIADLEEAIADLEHVADREQRAAIRDQRRAAVAQLDGVIEAAAGAVAGVDVAIGVLLAAYEKALPLIEAARVLSGDCLMQSAVGDPGVIAINRLLATNASSLEALDEQIARRLSDLGVLPPGAGGYFRPKTGTLAETFAHGAHSLRVRVQDRLLRDEAEAELEAA